MRNKQSATGDYMTKRGRKGKYDKWLTEENLLRVTAWARDGLTDKQIAKNMGIGEKTIHEWKKRFEVLDYAVEDGTQWSLDIKLTNNRSRHYYGSNAYPPYWPELKKIFREFAKF